MRWLGFRELEYETTSANQEVRVCKKFHQKTKTSNPLKGGTNE
jgi:hypothetical protein